MCRMNPVLHQAHWVTSLIAVIGVLTALFAATIATSQTDIKKVLAYSTISQLGYMFLGVGSEAYVGAVFMMIAHAFYKALLFLGAGSVIHGMHDEQDMRRMGRLRKFLPVTAGTFIVGWLAIAGVPPFSGFWAKDEILLNAWYKNPVLWALGIVTAFMTAYYMTRQLVMVFYGESHWEDAKDAHEAEVHASHADAHAQQEPVAVAAHEGTDDHGGRKPHESPWIMLIPLIVLAIGSIGGGVLNLPLRSNLEYLRQWLEPVVGASEQTLPDDITGPKLIFVLIAVIAALGGIVVAYLVYQRRRLRAIEPAVLAHAYYIDDELAAFVGGPGTEAFDGVAWFDQHVVDGAVMGTAALTRREGSWLRRFQSGFVRNYALGISLGAVLLLVWFVMRGVF
jgi:NADH-quinone oxidoreductase subunit L